MHRVLKGLEVQLTELLDLLVVASRLPAPAPTRQDLRRRPGAGEAAGGAGVAGAVVWEKEA